MNAARSTHPMVVLRTVDDGDEPFLFNVYSSTRLEELAQLTWDERQKGDFLGMQFRAQSRYYKSEYPGAEFHIILADGQPAGRLYLHRRKDEIRIMDISLLPQFRGRGIGTKLLKDILSEGVCSKRRVTIHVETLNRALRLYERLGFSAAGSNGVYQLLEWRPQLADEIQPSVSLQQS